MSSPFHKFFRLFVLSVVYRKGATTIYRGNWENIRGMTQDIVIMVFCNNSVIKITIL